MPTLDTIEIFGYPFESDFKSMILNGVPLGDSVKVNYDSAKQLLRIEGKNLINLSNNEQIVLMWSNS
ncbi:unnamed protein product [Anisakis simplex]|nr:unnamed protein product [Anisakis simplex]